MRFLVSTTVPAAPVCHSTPLELPISGLPLLADLTDPRRTRPLLGLISPKAGYASIV
jgi:hypothetical protein